MFNATDAGRNFSTSQEAAPHIDTENMMTALSENNDVISDRDMTVEDWLKNFQLIITLILLVLGK